MKRITITTHLNSFTGYGQAANAVVRGLVKFGYDVNVRAVAKSTNFGSVIPIDVLSRCVGRIQQEPWEILIHPPDFGPTPGKKTAYFTMWEAARIPGAAKSFLNQSSVVITPSVWNAACFSACGVDTPIRVVPLGIDPEIYHYKPWPRGEEFVFGTAGRTAHGGIRKGIEHVIEAFQLAFPMKEALNVRLKVKIFPDCKVEDPKDRRIEFIRKFMTEPELVEWLAGLHCFVSGARGEGWGLLQHQAMAIGRPVIAPKYGGLSEFMTDQNSLPVRFKLVTSETFYKGCGVWAEPDTNDLAAMMIQARQKPMETRELGWRAARDAGKLTWDNTMRELLRVVEEFGIA